VRILFQTNGVAGSGHIVLGLAVAAALRRAGLAAEFSILTASNEFAHLAELEEVALRPIPAEDAAALGPERYQSSALYQAIVATAPIGLCPARVKC